MTLSTVTKKEVNYTPAMIQVLRDNAPLNYEKAKTLAIELNRNARSIIAKAKREGISYEAKIAPAKMVRVTPTKAQLVSTIEIALGVASLAGLEKAPASALIEILKALPKS